LAEDDMSSTTCRHPAYGEQEWRKWRAWYEGGERVVEEYLKKFSDRADDAEFAKRKSLTPIPAHAKSAIHETKNSIFQRMADVRRKGGTPSYANAVVGLDGGVDFRGKSMNTFLGEEVIAELMVMRKVGVFVDMQPLQGPTLAHSYKLRPYLYRYRAEDI